MSKKILLIEDDQIFANIYRNKFRREGFEVEVAADGESGLQKTREFRPDAVLLDLILPNLSGVEVIKRIRGQPDLNRLPVIVFTNTYLTSAIQEARKFGATNCLAKAECTPRQVLGTVRQAMGMADETASLPPPAPAQTESPESSSPADIPRAELPDEEFQAEWRKSFVESLPVSLAALRVLLQGLIKAQNQAFRLQQVQQLYRRVRALTGSAGTAGLLEITQMTDALEALLKELHDKPKNINASTLRTLASAIDYLGIMFERTGGTGGKQSLEASVLVVDDEAVARRAIHYALEKASLKPLCVEDPPHALQLLAEKPFDLIFLDVDMPGMNGFELCSRLRALPACTQTPVIFITHLNDFENRAHSTMSGGNDFIGKPFLFIELAVKALVYVLRARLEATRPAIPAPGPVKTFATGF